MSDTTSNQGISGNNLQITNLGSFAVGDHATATTHAPSTAPDQATQAPPSQASGRSTSRERYLTVIALDIEGFNRSERDDPIRLRLRGDLHDILMRTLDDLGVSPAHRMLVESTGDGWFVLIDEAVSRAYLLSGVKTYLPHELRERNRMATVEAQMRVRVVVHAGEMLLTEEGAVVGQQLNLAFRLLDSDALRQCLKRTPAPLVLCVSEHLYHQVVRQRHPGCDPSEFTAVAVSVKETGTHAWVHVPR